MYATSDARRIPADALRGAPRPVSRRAALGIWAAASLSGWLVVAGLLRAFGAL